MIASDPRWWPFYLQRRVMNPQRRTALANLMARTRPVWTAATPDPDSASLLADLNVRGLAHLGPLLTREQHEAAAAHFRRHPVQDPYRPELGSFAPDSPNRSPTSHVAYHAAHDVVSAPGLLALANQPRLLDVAARFLGCKPTIAYMAAWWSFPTGLGPQQAELFHRDVDDWRFLKLFVYLSDVGPDNGPHVYVTTSATSTRLTEIRRFTDSEVATAFGAENLHTVVGTAGHGFLENTFGLHRGHPLTAGTRLIFQVVYSMFELPYGPKRPVASADPGRGIPAGLDPWINRTYLKLPTL